MSTTTSTISCKLCSKPFTDPRLLPCLHVFCKSCLESLQSKNEGTLTCPTCYKTSPHPPAHLPRHLRIERESTLSRIQEGGETKCGSCDENNKAEAYCEDCSSGICSGCVGVHKQLKGLKNHRVVSHSSVQLHSIPVELVSCAIHQGQIIQYYCISCSALVCSDCILDHKEHDCRHLNEAGDIERAELQSVLPEVEKAIPPVAEGIGKINKVVERINVNGEKITREVNEAFRQITAAVEKRRVDFLQEVKSLVAAETTQLKLQKEGLEKITAGLKLALQSGSVACNEYSAIEVLAVKSSIHNASKSLFEESRSTSIYPVSLRVEIDSSNVMEMVSTLGNVQKYSPHPPLCSLVGINPKLAIAAAKGCESIVTLQTRDCKGEDVTVGGVEIRGRVTFRSEVSECVVNDLGDGRYEISFDNPREGQHHLHITVDDVSISDSPFTVNVRDYTAIVSPVVSITTKGSPEYVDIGPNNLQYVSTCMLGGSIEIYENGRQVKEIPLSKFGDCNLRGIAVNKQSEVIFVANADTHQVIKASLDGEVIASVGDKGSGEQEFDWPWGLCLTEGGLLLVGDCTNHRVQVLGSDLSFIHSIPCQSMVYGVSVDSAGYVHAATTDRVEVFSINGEKFTEYGVGVLHLAGDVAFLNSQNRYSFVTDYVSDGKVFIFDWSKDTVVHSFPAGNHPLGIKVDHDGVIFVCCYGDRKMQRF